MWALEFICKSYTYPREQRQFYFSISLIYIFLDQTNRIHIHVQLYTNLYSHDRTCFHRSKQMYCLHTSPPFHMSYIDITGDSLDIHYTVGATYPCNIQVESSTCLFLIPDMSDRWTCHSYYTLSFRLCIQASNNPYSDSYKECDILIFDR